MPIDYHGRHLHWDAASVWTITNASVPNGRVLLAVTYAVGAGITNRSVSGITHPGLTNVARISVGAEQAHHFVDGSYRCCYAEVWQADGNGATGDLTVSFNATVWTRGLTIYRATGLGDPVAIGKGGGNQVGSFTVSASAAGAIEAVAASHIQVGNSSSVASASPLPADEGSAKPAAYEWHVTAHGGVQGSLDETFSLDSGDKAYPGAGIVVLFQGLPSAGGIVLFPI